MGDGGWVMVIATLLGIKFIFLKEEYTSTPKFPRRERNLIKNIVANLTIKRIDDANIIKVIFAQTNKTITARYLRTIRQQIKRESYHWYRTMREGEYEYIHEFRERINEILDLQKQHHEIIIRNEDNPGTQQTSLAELHRLTITLSNLYDIAPYLMSGSNNNGPSLSATPESKTTAGQPTTTTKEYIV